MEKQLAPMRLHRTYGTCHDTITCLDWSADSAFITVGSRDLTARLYSLHPIPGWAPPTLAGHKAALTGVFFTGPGTQDAAALAGQPRVLLYTASKDGALFGWALQPAAAAVALPPRSQDQQQPDQQQPEQQQQQQTDLAAPGVWVLAARHFFMQRGAKLSACDFHKGTGVLVAGVCCLCVGGEGVRGWLPLLITACWGGESSHSHCRTHTRVISTTHPTDPTRLQQRPL
jgi:periodic tryptophan protein 2